MNGSACGPSPLHGALHVFSVGLERDGYGLPATMRTFGERFRPIAPAEFESPASGDFIHAIPAFDMRQVITEDMHT